MDEERERRWCAWMAAAQGGDAAAYEKLLLELLPRVRAFVEHRVREPAAAEDVVQNAFLSMHRARHTYRPERPLSPWLFAIARNAVVDHARRRGRLGLRERSLEDAGVPEPAAPPDPPASRELAPELEAALRALPERQREAVQLLQLDGLGVAEAAQVAGVSRTALKVRAHRGYKALRRRLGGAP